MTEYKKRKSLRLPGFDYSQAGAYFVTICSYDKKCIFGRIINDHMHLSKVGKIVATIWQELPMVHQFVFLDNWIVMPNHLHGIVWLDETNGQKYDLSEIICLFKSKSALQVKETVGSNLRLWQRGFYEHIVRNEDDLFRIRQYIEDNPIQWVVDSENPESIL